MSDGRSRRRRYCVTCQKTHAPEPGDGCPGVPYALVAHVPPDITADFRRWCRNNGLSQGDGMTVAVLKLLRSGAGIPKYAEPHLRRGGAQ